MNKEKVPLVYLWIYRKMVERFGKENIIVTNREILEVMGRTLYQVSRMTFYDMLKEMQEYGLVERINDKKYRVNGAGSDKLISHLKEYFFW